MKEAEVIQLARAATIQIAKYLSVPYCEFYDTLELQKQIKEKDYELYEKLKIFIDSYWKYHFFINSISKRSLNKEDLNLLDQKDKEKDKVRNMLISFLESRNYKIII